MHKVPGEIYFIGVQSSAVLASGLMSTVIIYYKWICSVHVSQWGKWQTDRLENCHSKFALQA